jgi:hypothetical protein
VTFHRCLLVKYLKKCQEIWINHNKSQLSRKVLIVSIHSHNLNANLDMTKSGLKKSRF